MNSNFIFRQVSSYECLVNRELHSKGIVHGFVTNQLNLKNFDLSKKVDLPDIGHVSLAKQTHGTTVLNADEFGLEGDAFIVKSGEAAGVRTADCVPLILVNIKNLEIGAVVHAGWQGACAGVVESTVQKLIKMGYEMKHFIALIGPAALECCYEVKDDVASKFSSGTSVRDGITYLSVPEYVRNLLLRAGVDSVNIHPTNLCTICSDSFFSYRREGDSAGRFLSFLSLCRDTN